MRTQKTPEIRLGLRPNLAQFALLVGVNGLVGALVGQERSLVPLLGEEVFHVGSATALLMFIVTFGLAKAAANLAAGLLADRFSRKAVLVGGWIVALPVPVILMFAPSWEWVIVANVLLGLNQGLAWSMTVIMKIDLVGPTRRGLAMGLNEFAGYFALAVSASVSGWLAARYGLRPEPLFFGLAVAGLGLGLSILLVKDTSAHARSEESVDDGRTFWQVMGLSAYRHRPLAAVSRTGLINNSNDALVWGLVPVVMAGQGFSTSEIGVVAGTYPAVWGLVQPATGALSDRIGRRFPVALGMWVQALALVWFWSATSFMSWTGAAALLGLGTALAYPSLLAAIGDYASPSWRGMAVGTYRTWRDGGYVVGAMAAGLMTDAFGPGSALVLVAIVTAAAGWDAWINLIPIEDGAHS